MRADTFTERMPGRNADYTKQYVTRLCKRTKQAEIRIPELQVQFESFDGCSLLLTPTTSWLTVDLTKPVLVNAM